MYKTWLLFLVLKRLLQVSHCSVGTVHLFSFSLLGEDENGQYTSSINSSAIEWTEEMDRLFIGQMLELVHGGNMFGHVPDGSNWSDMIFVLNEKFGLQFDRSILEERYAALMKQHDEISSLLTHDGFSWDEIQQTVTAEDHVWEAYTKVCFLSTGIPFRKDKRMIDSSSSFYSNFPPLFSGILTPADGRKHLSKCPHLKAAENTGSLFLMEFPRCSNDPNLWMKIYRIILKLVHIGISAWVTMMTCARFALSERKRKALVDKGRWAQ